VKARRTSRTIWLSDLGRDDDDGDAVCIGELCVGAPLSAPPVVCASAQVAQIAMATAAIAPIILLARFFFTIPPLPDLRALP
jgi:hypothetical protein